MSVVLGADTPRAERRALVAAVAVAVATSVHHAYGAILYHTPWRYDAVAVSAGTIALLLAALRVSRVAADTALGRGAWWTFWGVNAAVFVLLLGAFEGLYNHVVKDLLYFGGAPVSVVRALFPAPTYELPNNWLFETTGVLQVVFATMAGIQLARLLSHRPRRVVAPRPVTDRAVAIALARAAQWTLRVTGPVLVALGTAFWAGRAVSLRPAHMLVGMVFDLAFASLVVLAALRGMRAAAVFAGLALALAIPLFGVVQARILLGSMHWVVRSTHLVFGLMAMFAGNRLARFVSSARVAAARDAVTSPSEMPRTKAVRRAIG